MIAPEKIIVALDVSEKEEVSSLMNSIKGHEVWLKIGMELFYAQGPEVITMAKDMGFKVFLDLKLHDIPTTVEKAIKSLVRLPIDMLNVHAAGGKEMMERAIKAAHSVSNPPKLIAVTQLTSTTTEQMNREQKIMGGIQESVSHYAKIAHESGLDGVVSSPHEVSVIKDLCGKSFLTVTPGIRPKTSDNQDQKRVTTPLEAMNLGTDYMVIGRPITQAEDPREALEMILKGK